METSKHGELGSGGGGEGSGQYRYIRMNFNLEKCILHGKMFLLHTQCHSCSFFKPHTQEPWMAWSPIQDGTLNCWTKVNK